MKKENSDSDSNLSNFAFTFGAVVANIIIRYVIFSVLLYYIFEYIIWPEIYSNFNISLNFSYLFYISFIVILDILVFLFSKFKKSSS